MIKSTESPHLTLQDVKEHFDHWRKTRDKRRKIPESLWSEVRLLVDHYPTSKITKVLGINSAQLSTAINSQSDFTFVTASTDGLNNPADSIHELPIESIDEKYSIEVHRPNGGMLRITGLPIVSLGNIINQFIG